MKYFRGIAFLLLAGLLGVWANGVFMHKDACYRCMKRFFSESGDRYDVLAFGPSYMFCTLDPVELYRSTGLRAFCPGTSVQRIEATEHYVNEALRRYRPRVVLLEASMLFWDEQPAEYVEAYAHAASDPYPLCPEKWTMIRSFVVRDDPVDYLFPLIKYHQRWKRLGREDFVQDLSQPELHFNGYRMHVSTFRNAISPIDFAKADPAPVSEVYLRALDRMHEAVRAKGVEFLLVLAPRHGYSGDKFRRCRSLMDYASSRGIRCIDMMSNLVATGIANETDFYDGGHLNVRGAKKATHYIGRYLKEHCAFDHVLSDEERAWWKAECDRHDSDLARALKSGCRK